MKKNIYKTTQIVKKIILLRNKKELYKIMAKKTGFEKVLARTGYVVIERVNRIKTPPFKEVVTILDFTKR